MKCEERIGFTRGNPRRCSSDAVLQLVNQAGRVRYFCDLHLKEYKDSWGISMGTEQAATFWAKSFTVIPLVVPQGGQP